MATTNKLDASGLLYEGSDFEKWQRALRPILIQHFPGLYWPNPYWAFHLPPKVSNSDVCDSIWWQVSPHVRSRVPEEGRKTPGRLLSTLRATSQPFRFMDLPTEIRLRVYKIELAAKPSLQTFNLLTRTDDSALPPFEYNENLLTEPRILSASHHVRMEALPVYYRDISFNLVFNGRILKRIALLNHTDRLRQIRSDPIIRRWRPTNAERVDAIHKWASTIVPDSMRNLRKISVQLPLLAICSRQGREDMLHFSLSIVNGEPKLHVAPHQWLKPVSQELLRDHASASSKLAQTLKLEGEALIMALVSRPEIWDQLELADK
jgi:hypothetical protein